MFLFSPMMDFELCFVLMFVLGFCFMSVSGQNKNWKKNEQDLWLLEEDIVLEYNKLLHIANRKLYIFVSIFIYF